MSNIITVKSLEYSEECLLEGVEASKLSGPVLRCFREPEEKLTCRDSVAYVHPKTVYKLTWFLCRCSMADCINVSPVLCYSEQGDFVLFGFNFLIDIGCPEDTIFIFPRDTDPKFSGVYYFMQNPEKSKEKYHYPYREYLDICRLPRLYRPPNTPEPLIPILSLRSKETFFLYRNQIQFDRNITRHEARNLRYNFECSE